MTRWWKVGTANKAGALELKICHSKCNRPNYLINPLLLGMGIRMQTLCEKFIFFRTTRNVFCLIIRVNTSHNHVIPPAKCGPSPICREHKHDCVSNPRGLDNTLIRMGEQWYAEDEERGPNPIPRPLQYESIPCGWVQSRRTAPRMACGSASDSASRAPLMVAATDPKSFAEVNATF